MARDIDRKLRVTAAVLGLVTRKDLAAAFRRVNAATTFDIERAHKWLQGRSSPRDARLYQDWALVLDIDRSAEWIANSEFDAFLDVVAARHNADRETLTRQAIPTHSGGFHRREWSLLQSSRNLRLLLKCVVAILSQLDNSRSTIDR